MINGLGSAGLWHAVFGLAPKTKSTFPVPSNGESGVTPDSATGTVALPGKNRGCHVCTDGKLTHHRPWKVEKGNFPAGMIKAHCKIRAPAHRFHRQAAEWEMKKHSTPDIQRSTPKAPGLAPLASWRLFLYR
jgi:hypothetical protein